MAWVGSLHVTRWYRFRKCVELEALVAKHLNILLNRSMNVRCLHFSTPA